MISDWKADEVKRLLRDGKLSQRQIAIQVDVSRGTVGAIARGRRPDYEALRRKRNEGFVPPVGPAERCPGCGAKAQPPCVACQVRSIVRRREKPTVELAPPGYRMARPWRP